MLGSRLYNGSRCVPDINSFVTLDNALQSSGFSFLGYQIRHQLSDFRVYENYLSCWLKQRSLGPTLRVSESLGLG